MILRTDCDSLQLLSSKYLKITFAKSEERL